MKILTDFRFYVVVTTLAFSGLLIGHLNYLDDLEKTKEELIMCQTDKDHIPGGDITNANLSQSTEDSLRNELFNKNVEVGRYEMTLEIFKEKNKSAAQEFELILTTQTE